MALKARNGENLLRDFEAAAEAVSFQANDRASVVNERIASLESELAALRQLQRKVRAVQAA